MKLMRSFKTELALAHELQARKRLGQSIRRLLRCVWISIVLAGVGEQSAAAEWKPERAVEIITTASAGGNLDIAARAIQKIWRDQKLVLLSQVMNKPGGAGAIANTYLSQHAGDPHYLLTWSMTPFASQIMGQSNYSHADFSPISLLFGQYVYVSVREDSPIKTGKDLIDRLRREPESLSIAIATAVANSIHMGIAIPMKAAGVNVKRMKVVAFKSSGESMTNLLGGHVDVVASTFGTVIPHFNARRIRVIGFSAAERLPGALSDVPTWREQGADATFSSWLGIVGAKGISASQIAYWENAFARLANSDEWREDLNRNFRAPMYMNSRDTRKFWDTQYADIKGILTDLGLAKRAE